LKLLTLIAVIAAAACAPPPGNNSAATEASIAALEMKLANLEKQLSATPQDTKPTIVDVPRNSPRIVKDEEELTKFVTFQIESLTVPESTNVRVRYQWDYRIRNTWDQTLWVSPQFTFLDANGREVVQTDLRTSRARAVRPGEEIHSGKVYYLRADEADFVDGILMSVLPTFSSGYVGAHGPTPDDISYGGVLPRTEAASPWASVGSQ
jgi:hypothetical protein